jgi:TnpA family transposase
MDSFATALPFNSPPFKRIPGQNLPVFGLSSLLGIELMPRIRNWEDLTFYRPDSAPHYTHIESLFGDQVVDWERIKTHWRICCAW